MRKILIALLLILAKTFVYSQSSQLGSKGSIANDLSTLHMENMSIDTLNSTVKEVLQLTNYINKQMPFYKQSNETKIEMARCYANLANIYYNIDGCQNIALELCDSVKKIILEVPKNIRLEMFDYATVCHVLSGIYSQLGKEHLAGELLRTSIEIMVKLKKEVPLEDYSFYMKLNPDSIDFNQQLCNSILSKHYLEKKDDPDLYYIWLELANTLSNKLCKLLSNTEYKDTTQLYELADTCDYAFSKAKDIFDDNQSYFVEKSNYYPLYSYNYLYGQHLARLEALSQAIGFYEKAVELAENNSLFIGLYPALVQMIHIAGNIQDGMVLHKYLPRYYDLLVKDIIGTSRSLSEEERYIFMQRRMGETLYRIPELAMFLPNDSICCGLAYNSALLSKHLLVDLNNLSNKGHLSKSINQLKSAIVEEDNALNYVKMSNLITSLQRKNYETTELLDVYRWQDVQRNLEENDVAIEFVNYPLNTWSWSEDSVRFHYSALILRKTDDYPIFVDLCDDFVIDAIYNLQPKSYRKDSNNTVYNIIWSKLEPFLNTKGKVYFSPQGKLALINIEVFQDGNGQCISEKYNLCRLSSTKQVGLFSDSLQLKNVAVYGGIFFSKSLNSDSEDISILNSRGNWSYLKSTEIESSEITNELASNSVTVLLYNEDNGTENSFKELSGKNVDVIHMATHGFYVPIDKRNRVPYYKNHTNNMIYEPLMYSGLILANGHDTWNNGGYTNISDDGILLSYEIEMQDFRKVDMVVLSACETGLGDYNFDGIQGIQTAFKMAGVRTIIMSLWKIDDAATALMMTYFYRELLKTGSKHKSFRKAQDFVRKQYEDPYYWAGFIMLD